jgi:hypothetical protein
LAVVVAVLEAAEVAEDAPVESQASKSVDEKSAHKAFGVFEGLVFFPTAAEIHSNLQEPTGYRNIKMVDSPLPPGFLCETRR